MDSSVGDCIGVVYRTGDDTMIGHIASLTSGQKKKKKLTPEEKKSKRDAEKRHKAQKERQLLRQKEQEKVDKAKLKEEKRSKKRKSSVTKEQDIAAGALAADVRSPQAPGLEHPRSAVISTTTAPAAPKPPIAPGAPTLASEQVTAPGLGSTEALGAGTAAGTETGGISEGVAAFGGKGSTIIPSGIPSKEPNLHRGKEAEGPLDYIPEGVTGGQPDKASDTGVVKTKGEEAHEEDREFVPRSKATSTMQVEIRRLIIFVAILAFFTAIIFFTIALARGLGFVFAFVNAFILVLVSVRLS